MPTCKSLPLSLLALVLAWFCGAVAAEVLTSPYAGQHTRPIKSLSAYGVTELGRGGGWEFVRAAELNGMPGPAHLLELKDEIPLSAQYVAAVSAVFEEMLGEAVSGGEHLVAQERTLEVAVRAGTVSDHLCVGCRLGSARLQR